MSELLDTCRGAVEPTQEPRSACVNERTRPCPICTHPIAAKSRSGPIPKHHEACWRIARGGSASGEHQRKLRAQGLCVECREPVAERNPRTGKPRCRCAACSRLRRAAYQERKGAVCAI